MKELIGLFIITALAILSLNGCKEVGCDNRVVEYRELEKPQENIDSFKDSLINAQLSEGEIRCKLLGETDYFFIQLKDVKITVCHEMLIEFEQKESWAYWGDYKNGELCFIEAMGLDSDLSNETLERIKQLCISYKLKQ